MFSRFCQYCLIFSILSIVSTMSTLLTVPTILRNTAEFLTICKYLGVGFFPSPFKFLLRWPSIWTSKGILYFIYWIEVIVIGALFSRGILWVAIWRMALEYQCSECLIVLDFDKIMHHATTTTSKFCHFLDVFPSLNARGFRPLVLVFSCPGQLNRWHCQSVSN